MVVIVAVFDGCGWEVVVVGEVGSGAVVPVHPSGGRGFEVGASLPGAVAPDELALVGLVEGLGGGVVVGGTHGSGGGLDPLLDESSGVGDGQVLRSVVAVVDQPLQVRAPRSLRAWIACSRALPALSVSMRLLVAQPTMRRAYRSMTNAV